MVLDHSCHGSQGTERCYKEEDQGKYIREISHALRVRGEFHIAADRLPVEYVPLPARGIQSRKGAFAAAAAGLRDPCDQSRCHVRECDVFRHLLFPDPGPLFGERLKAIYKGIHLLLVGVIRIAVIAVQSFQFEINSGVDILCKAFRR